MTERNNGYNSTYDHWVHRVPSTLIELQKSVWRIIKYIQIYSKFFLLS